MAKGPRKAYFGILGLAAVGLLADRIFSDGPRAARADTAPAEDLAVAPDQRQTPVVPVSSDTAASRLAGFALREDPAGDLGAVPAWLRPPEAPAAAKGAPEKPFAERHHVAGFTRGQTVGVSLGGRFLRVGDVIEGMTLVEVDAEAGVAVFRGAGGEARLPLPVPRLDQASENGRPAAPTPK